MLKCRFLDFLALPLATLSWIQVLSAHFVLGVLSPTLCLVTWPSLLGVLQPALQASVMVTLRLN